MTIQHETLASVQTVGIMGGGQLGMMLAQSAKPLGIRCSFLENDEHCPASRYGQVFPITAAGLDAFLASADQFTYEFENTPIAHAQYIETNKPLAPNTNALAATQQRITEKNLLKELGIPVAPFVTIKQPHDLQLAVSTLGLPFIIKTAQGGYDGKGQFVIRSLDDITDELKQLAASQLLIAEGFITFSRELSIIAVRSKMGETRCWPLAQNHHHQGILSHSIIPAPASDHAQAIAESYIQTILNHLDYVGVMTLELFDTAQGLIANEMAPRVHNSGHWSIEGAACSQFENHMRAISGLDLGSTALCSPCVMINIIGQHPDATAIGKHPNTYMHLYHKSERLGRKLGHITVLLDHIEAYPEALRDIASDLPNPMGLLSSS